MTRKTYGRSCISLILDALCVVIVVAAADVSRGSDGSVFWKVVVVVGLARFALAIAANGIDKAHQRGQQELRRERAKAILQALDEGRQAPRFALYLRSFQLDDWVPVANPRASDSILSLRRNLPSFISLEERIGRAFEESTTMVCLGTDSVGPGSASADDSRWWEDFQRLARRADFVLVFPAPSTGLCREVAFLASADMLGKVVWMLPPMLDDNSQFWSLAASAFDVVNVRLPVYDPQGFLFTLGSVGDGCFGPKRLTAFPNGKDAKLRAAVRSLVDGSLPPSDKPEVEPTMDEVLEDCAATALQGLKEGESFDCTMHLMTNHVVLEKDYSSNVAPCGPIISHVSREDDILSRLLESVELELVVGIGEMRAHIACGGIVRSRDDWFSFLGEFARLSRHIFVEPLERCGVADDLAAIREQECLHKVIAYMPPAVSCSRPVGARWEESRATLAKRGFSLPEYSNRGMLFGFDSSCATVSQTTIGPVGSFNVSSTLRGVGVRK